MSKLNIPNPFEGLSQKVYFVYIQAREQAIEMERHHN
jgi:hypothetical protein